MVALSFSVFKDKLLSGEKRYTIRELNITRLEQMNRLGIQVYWKQRTSESEFLFDAKLTGVDYIVFNADGTPRGVGIVADPFAPFPINGYPVDEFSIREQKELAERDGFKSLDDMATFFYKKYGKKLVESDIFPEIPTYFAGIKFEEVKVVSMYKI